MVKKDEEWVNSMLVNCSHKEKRIFSMGDVANRRHKDYIFIY